MKTSLSLAALLSLSLLSAVPAMAQVPESPPVAPASTALPSFEDLAEKLSPTVVNISTTMKLKLDPQEGAPMQGLPQFPPGSPFEQFFKEFYDQYKNQQPQGDQKASSLGSGFVIDAKEGYIVTNNHVIKDADEIKVILHDDTSLDATLIGTDDKTDIALLKVKPPSTPLVAATWGDSDKAKVGSWVLAIGNPFGLGGTVTAGIVSARQRDINAGPYDDFIQTDASINRGNSGGPMFNANGAVIGVNTAIFSPSGGSVGIGFAVPSNLAKSVVAQLAKYGKTKRGWLGVRIQDVTPEIAESLGLPAAKGALVSTVTPKGPSALAGIVPGDVILKFNGLDINHMRKLPRMVAESEVGRKVTLTLLRKKKEQDVTVELGQLETAEADQKIAGSLKVAPVDKTAPASTPLDAIGVNVAAIDDKLRQTFSLDLSAQGVLITDVKPNGVAAEKGLTPGDTILEIDQETVTTPDELKTKVEAAQKAGRASVLLFIARGEDRRFVPVKLAKK